MKIHLSLNIPGNFTLALTEIRNSLDFVEKQTPMPKGMNDIPMYSLWWTIILHDYYFKTLDKEYLKTKISYLDLLLNQINNCVLDDGNLKFPMNFLDWPTSKDEELIYGVHALTKISLNCISKIYNVLNINNEVIGHISSKLYKFKRRSL